MTYSAIIRNDTVEWTTEHPEIGEDVETEVYITFLNQPSAKASDSKARIREILERLSGRQTSSLPEDPLAWQQEMRSDRRLPMREE